MEKLEDNVRSDMQGTECDIDMRWSLFWATPSLGTRSRRAGTAPVWALVSSHDYLPWNGSSDSFIDFHADSFFDFHSAIVLIFRVLQTRRIGKSGGTAAIVTGISRLWNIYRFQELIWKAPGFYERNFLWIIPNLDQEALLALFSFRIHVASSYTAWSRSKKSPR